MKKKAIPVIAAAGIIVILIFAMLVTALVKKYTPSKEKADLKAYFGIESQEEMAIIWNQEVMKDKAFVDNKHVYVSYDFIRKNINSRFYFDKIENKLLYTTAENVITVEAASSDYYIGNKKQAGEVGAIFKLDADRAYINIDFVKQYSDLIVQSFFNPNRITLQTDLSEYQSATLLKDSEIRVKGGIKSPILTEISKNKKVQVLDKMDDWTKVATNNGFIGYVKNKMLSTPKKEQWKFSPIKETFSHVLREDAICLAWHQVTNQTVNTRISNILAGLKGVNVISPTWFYLSDDSGNIANLASSDYVNQCHQKGIEVWGLVSNLEQKVDTTSILSRTSTREKLVNNLVAAAIEKDLDGINVDMESLDPKAGEGYVQFIRELALKCHKNDLILSVDNYVPTDYTAFYNRKEQAQFADYIIIMAYDEHYAGSDEGSVSSISFVTNGIQDTLKEVPAKQTIVALPFYTRLWEVTSKTNEEGVEISKDVKSQAYGMDSAQGIVDKSGVKTKWDEKAGQYYLEYQNSGKTYKMWLEEEKSLSLKLEQVKKNKLAGAAFWKLGFERDSIWDTIIKYVN